MNETLDNCGCVLVNGAFNVNGTFNNYADSELKIAVGGQNINANPGSTINNLGLINAMGGTANFNSGSTTTNFAGGFINIANNTDIDGTVTNESTAIILVGNQFSVNGGGDLTNEGEIYVSGNTISNGGTISGVGTIFFSGANNNDNVTVSPLPDPLPTIPTGACNVTMDLGDLPDLADGTAEGDYETLLMNGGPSHFIMTGIKLGASVDAEADGQPSALADGDGADEDGISSFPTFVAGQSAVVTVSLMNMTGGNANLYGFIDFNNDGGL
ncbi:MAG: hypothetical protein HC840_30590 [Leptolyngbyaceae cyanobacterium RM2_2_4]|nr:hypothetical protein [Leptolyngbyaceae cyanobacterium RM2_2_4]